MAADIPDHRPPVVVVGGGIAGVACARRLAHDDIPVVVLDRGRRLGGRIAVRTTHDRIVDVGASYFTVKDEVFGDVVESWHARGLARHWTDTFHTGGPDGLGGTKPGPMRWAAPLGLRSLVEDLAADLDVRQSSVSEVGPALTVDGSAARAVVLAMPDPQARRILGQHHPTVAAALDRDWAPSLVLSAGWQLPGWPSIEGVFVADDDVLTWIADDGRRRGDGAPVLVVHTAADFARGHLTDPAAAEPAILAALSRVLGVREPPTWTHTRRWTYAHPVRPREQTYLLSDSGVGVCGDGWAARPRVEAAFLSGDALGAALVRRLRHQDGGDQGGGDTGGA